MTAWLLTWLWQGSALAGGVAVALAWTPRVNAATRHLIWWGALVALAWLGWASSPYAAMTALKSCATATTAAIGGTGLQPCPLDPAMYVPSAPDVFLTIIAGIWAAIALVSLLRLLPGLRGVYALRDRCEPFPTTVESRLPLWLEARARGRRTQLMLCNAVPGATVLGFERPYIAIPSSLVDGLTIDELDQVILHEHAHVQRRDDWSRLAQTLMCAVLWVHPAALFVSRALSREREMACDERVVARTGRPKAYARCLARAAELRLLRCAPALVPALVGGRHELVRRVERLLEMRTTPRHPISLGAATLAACAMMLVSVQLHRVRFAEIAEIVLPHVSAPLMTMYPRVTNASAEMPVTVPRKPVTVRLQADPTYDEPEAPDASSAPNAPVSATVSARIFTGAYDAPLAPLAPLAPDTPLAPLTGIAPRVALTTKKASLAIAGVFTRAGASLARVR